MILFLDFDGVLHPDSAYLVNGRPVLRDDGSLFMWSPLLNDVLKEFSHVEIVLSTSWVRELGFSRARRYLPAYLQNRVIGATWHSQMAADFEYSQFWNASTRYQQIRRYVHRAALKNWIAIDDDGDGWSLVDSDKLILTDSQLGISEQSILLQLVHKLKQ